MNKRFSHNLQDKPWACFFSVMVTCMVALPGAGLALSFLPFSVWPLETASLWIPFYLLLALLGGCGGLVLGRYRWAGAGFLCAAVALAAMAPYYWRGASSEEAGGQPNLRILQVNVYEPGDTPDALLELITDTRPDVILLQEVNEKWKRFLVPLEDSYPHSHHGPRYTGGGLDLAHYSSLEPVAVTELHGLGIPATEIRLEVNGLTLCLLNAHTAAPFSPGRARRYYRQMGLLTAYVARQESPIILAGDLNSGFWSRPYRRLLKAGNLVSARQGFGALGTWPSFFGPFRIALDHILVSPDLQVVRCWTGPPIGSDHRPLLADLQLSGSLPTYTPVSPSKPTP